MAAMNAILKTLRSAAPAVFRSVAQQRQPSLHAPALLSILHSSPFTTAAANKATALAGGGGAGFCQWTSFLLLRRMSSSASVSDISKSNPEEKLLRVLEAEIECALEDANDIETEPEGTILFDIEDTPGTKSVLLRRKYGNEEITVEVFPLDIGGAEEEDNDDGNEAQQNFTVTISKGDGPCLEFNCSAHPDEVLIDTIAMKPSATVDNDAIAYQGPDFLDLDENLQKSFHKYLEVRGINGSLASYMSEYMILKDNKEYTRWLNTVKDFVRG